MTQTTTEPIDPNAVTVEEGIPRLTGGRCSRCGKYFFPFRDICTDCFTAGKVEKVPISSRGTLISYSVVRRAPGRQVPYAIGYLSTAEDLVVFAPLAECDMENLHQGMEMEVVFEEMRDRRGKDVITYSYRPVNNAKGQES